MVAGPDLRILRPLMKGSTINRMMTPSPDKAKEKISRDPHSSGPHHRKKPVEVTLAPSENGCAFLIYF